jgi:hypothetical protein
MKITAQSNQCIVIYELLPAKNLANKRQRSQTAYIN